MMRCKDSRVQNKPGVGSRERLGRTPWAAQSSPAAEATGKEGLTGNSPERGAFSPRDLQEVIAILQLEVNEDQGDGVPELSQNGPRAVGIVMVLGGEVGAGDDATLPTQGSAAGVVRYGERHKVPVSGGVSGPWFHPRRQKRSELVIV